MAAGKGRGARPDGWRPAELGRPAPARLSEQPGLVLPLRPPHMSQQTRVTEPFGEDALSRKRLPELWAGWARTHHSPPELADLHPQVPRRPRKEPAH